ncbi:MAG: PDZ domain-containing protein [Akkermansiaceae bacterium]|nr:PDZ domain-containing protein [Akkermansiaceae bacterium]
MNQKYSFSTFCFSLFFVFTSCCDKESCQNKKNSHEPEQQSTINTSNAEASVIRQSLVRINSTIQVWSASQPWDKSAPKKRRALGALLQGNRVLTTAEMAADATYIELENADNTRIIPAKVTAIDYEANLALLEPDNGDTDSFFKDLKPLGLGSAAKIGDRVDVWQLEDNGMPIVTDAVIQSVDIVSSFANGHFFLTYEAKGSMQSASNSFTVPVIRNGKLLGLLSSYDSKDQIVDIIAPEIIQAFIADTSDGDYVGFPSLGIGITSTVDPSFRDWLKLSDDLGGLYVTKIRKDSAAQKAGLEKGDVIININDKAIGRRGYYSDEQYGRLYWSHLIRGSLKQGDSVELTILRGGEQKQLTATLSRPEEPLVARDTYDQAPLYLLKGGLIFQELTATYLKAFGKEWQSKAPLNLLDIMMTPEDYEQDRNKIVFLSAVIPTPATTGYERLRNFIINKVNGHTVADISSLIEAFKQAGADGLHTIEFAEGPPRTIYLDAQISDTVDAELLKRGIPALTRE